MNVRTEKDIEQDFISFLHQHGYSKDSLISQPFSLKGNGGQRTYRPDLVIVDPQKNEHLAVIEIKREIRNARQAEAQLNAYREALGDKRIPIFLVTPPQSNESSVSFQLYTFDEEKQLQPIDFSLFPSFKALTAEETTVRKDEIRAKTKRVVDRFQWICWALALLLLVLVIADYWASRHGLKLVTTERLALVGGIVALMVLPFAQKFRGLGIEWERATSDKTKDT